MKKIQKQYINKGRTFEKKVAQMKWDKLRELIRESGIFIKIDSEHEMWLKITPDSAAEIELYPHRLLNGEFVQIKLWDYQFNLEGLKNRYREYGNSQKAISGIPEALQQINRILKDVRTDIKYKE
ncbi:hypothetical protein AB6F19_04785 [Staphylococcus haemolyticus]|uniref:hypothetical protein n=1 Tax=Staphylococcus haemolyticus TaxID=1283 RepID=UPI0034DCF717